MKQLSILLSFLVGITALLLFVDLESLQRFMDGSLATVAQTCKGFTLTPVQIGGTSVPIVLIFLLCAATYFTIYFRFVNLTKFKLAIDIVRGKHDNKTEASDSDNLKTIQADHIKGEVSHMQALTSAISATVGLGNIAGVAIAISIGGPGATFWMMVAGLIGMASKFTECTLGVRYRDEKSGTVYGGPMYYLSKGMKEKGYGKLGLVFGYFYAIMCVGGAFGGGNMFQSNQAALMFTSTIGAESATASILFGMVLSMVVALVLIGGIRRIGKLTEKIVPLMCAIYLGAALIILLFNYTLLPEAIASIFRGAFSPTSAAGGFLGVLVVGFQRAAFSNEAGVGSAAIVHSAVKTAYPASEGVVALLEPFIDTVVVCTITALVIIVFNINGAFEYGNVLNDAVWMEGLGRHVGGTELTALAFDSVIPGFSYVLTVAVILFAFSSMLAWSYYGLTAWKFLFGKSELADIIYKLMFCFFIVLGSASSLTAVLDFSDAMVFAMIFPNLIGLIVLAPVVKEELDRYLAHLSNKVKN